MSKKLLVLLILTTLFRFLGRFVMWLIVPFILLAAYKVPSTNIPYRVRLSVQRYALPKWLSWTMTPDDMLPGPLYEPGFAKVYNRFGTWVAAWVNLSFRNVLYGMMWKHGKSVTNYLVHLDDSEQKRLGVWQTIYPLGPIKFKLGWNVHRIWKDTDTDDIWTHTFWAVPAFSIRWNKQD